MAIKSLYDLKEILNKMSDEDLLSLGFGFPEGDNELQFLYYGEEENWQKFWEDCDKKYPKFKSVRDWFKVLFDVSEVIGHDHSADKLDQVYELGEPISSEFKFD